MKTGFRSAFRYQFSDFMAGIVIYMAVMVVLAVAIVITAFRLGGNTGFNDMSIVSAITVFVFGIAVPRGNFRLCAQLGVSRRSAFLSLLLAALSVSAILAAAGEVYTGVLQLIAAGQGQFYVADLYQTLYIGYVGEGMVATPLSFFQHLISGLLNICMLLCAFTVGVFFTLLFWRLRKAWKIVVAIAIPFAINGISILLSRFSAYMKPFYSWLGSRVYHLDLFFLLLTLLFAAIEWLLLRRAYIRSSSSV